ARRRSRERSRAAGSLRAPEDREAEAFEEPVARLFRQPRSLEQLDNQLQVGEAAAALGDTDPLPPADAPLAERRAFRRRRQQPERLIHPAPLREPVPRAS